MLVWLGEVEGGGNKLVKCINRQSISKTANQRLCRLDAEKTCNFLDQVSPNAPSWAQWVGSTVFIHTFFDINGFGRYIHCRILRHIYCMYCMYLCSRSVSLPQLDGLKSRRTECIIRRRRLPRQLRGKLPGGWLGLGLAFTCAKG